MKQKSRTSITWSDEHQQLAEIIVKKYMGKMELLDIPTHSANRKHGEQVISRSGAVLMALMIAAGNQK